MAARKLRCCAACLGLDPRCLGTGSRVGSCLRVFQTLAKTWPREWNPRSPGNEGAQPRSSTVGGQGAHARGMATGAAGARCDGGCRRQPPAGYCSGGLSVGGDDGFAST